VVLRVYFVSYNPSFGKHFTQVDFMDELKKIVELKLERLLLVQRRT